MSVFPVNRVPDILKRMDLNSSQAEAMKTCFGILAIMSREDSNKLLIAKDGMEIILNAMTVHVDRTDVQESGCDLLWSLAFNSSAVKDIIAKYGGSVVLVRALKRHSRSADFLKSACGALSNMCQCKLNQEGVSSQGGLQPLVGSIHVHQTNAKLLPFIFDAIASIIVNNEDNARTVSSLGIVPVVVASLSRHKTGMEVVKSGCHTLAILSDVKGQASKIAFAGGVPIILSLLDAHPLYSDLHRVAAVVLLRMLQESAHVGREITCHEGVRILLNSLEKGGAQQDTVAAVTHILYTVTNPSSPAAASIEPQLWLPSAANSGGAGGRGGGGGGDASSTATTAGDSPARKSSVVSELGSAAGNTSSNSLSSMAGGGGDSSGGGGGGGHHAGSTALCGVVMILGQYSARRDVVRAACRLINNLSGFANVVPALDRLGILDKIFECASIHRDTKDVLDSASSLVKSIHRRGAPVLQVGSPPCLQGLLHVFRVKSADEDASVACMDTLSKHVELTFKAQMTVSAEKRKEYEEAHMIDGKIWEHTALATSLTILQHIVDVEKDSDGGGGSSSGGTGGSVSGTASPLLSATGSPLKASAVAVAVASATLSTAAGKVIWNKGTAKVVASALSFIETLYHMHKLAAETVVCKDTIECLGALLRIMVYKSTDLSRRIEKLLSFIDVFNKQPLVGMGMGMGTRGKSYLSLKPPLPSSGSSASLLEAAGTGAGAGAASPGAGGGSFTFNGVPVRRGDDGSSGQQQQQQSPLAMGRKVVPSNGGGGSSGADGDTPAEELKRTFSKSKSWNSSSGSNLLSSQQQQQQEQSFTDLDVTSNGRRFLPQHPLKRKRNQQQQGQAAPISSSGGGGGGGAGSAGPQRLLDNWPNYLERLSMSPGLMVNRAYLNPSGQDSSMPTRMFQCYESSSAAGRGLLSKCPTPVPYIVPPAGLGEPFEHTLTFDADFESGNLLRAVQKGDANYDLFLRSDLHTPGHTQWFYFAVANTHPPDLVRLAEQGQEVPPVRVRFNIVNFTKPDSLFNLGMRPVVYSAEDAAKKNVGWVRSGSDISYYGNSFLRGNSAGEGLAYYYTLSFTLEFHNPKDTVLVAYSYPYTYSDYRSHLGEILDRPGSHDVIRQFKLCQTLSGEDCDLLVVTNFADKEKEKIGPITVQAAEFSGMKDENGVGVFGTGMQTAVNGYSGLGGSGGGGGGGRGSFAPVGGSGAAAGGRKGGRQAQVQLKPGLFLSCRVHPGETPASWMMKGMLEFLTSDCSQAVLLRQVFVIFIVPMLNPDGVIYGNNRCALAGVDLNRQWKTPIKSLHPTVHFLKYFMLAQRKIREINMYIDLHGHSRKYNVFMYGCDDKKRPKPQVRAFPKFFSMHSVGRKYVCYSDCSFNVKKGRESTARVVVAKEINIPCSFTLEATFCGSNYGPLKHCHMNIGHMQEVGSALCDAILNFSISEGQVKDTMLVPANLKAVAQVERAIAAEGLGPTSGAGAGAGAGAGKSGGFYGGMDGGGNDSGGEKEGGGGGAGSISSSAPGSTVNTARDRGGGGNSSSVEGGGGASAKRGGAAAVSRKVSSTSAACSTGPGGGGSGGIALPGIGDAADSDIAVDADSQSMQARGRARTRTRSDSSGGGSALAGTGIGAAADSRERSDAASEDTEDNNNASGVNLDTSSVRGGGECECDNNDNDNEAGSDNSGGSEDEASDAETLAVASSISGIISGSSDPIKTRQQQLQLMQETLNLDSESGRLRMLSTLGGVATNTPGAPSASSGAAAAVGMSSSGSSGGLMLVKSGSLNRQQMMLAMPADGAAASSSPAPSLMLGAGIAGVGSDKLNQMRAMAAASSSAMPPHLRLPGSVASSSASAATSSSLMPLIGGRTSPLVKTGSLNTGNAKFAGGGSGAAAGSGDDDDDNKSSTMNDDDRDDDGDDEDGGGGGGEVGDSLAGLSLRESGGAAGANSGRYGALATLLQ
jgi:hypothetical protein